MCQLKAHETTKSAWIWACIDFSDIDVDQKLTTFLARFKSVEGKHVRTPLHSSFDNYIWGSNSKIDSEKFKETMEKFYLENQELDWPTKKKEDAEEAEGEKKEDEEDDQPDA